MFYHVLYVLQRNLIIISSGYRREREAVSSVHSLLSATGHGRPPLPSLSNIIHPSFHLARVFEKLCLCLVQVICQCWDDCQSTDDEDKSGYGYYWFSIHLFIHLISLADYAIACSASGAATSIENLANQVLTNHLSTSIGDKTRVENSEGIDRGRNDYCNTNTCGAD